MINREMSSLTSFRTWWKRYGTLPAEDWIQMGFAKHGIRADEGRFEARVSALISAIRGQPYISYNARIALMKLTGVTRNTTAKTTKDAHNYWTSWWSTSRVLFYPSAATTGAIGR